jgi:hypothetical protein
MHGRPKGILDFYDANVTIMGSPETLKWLNLFDLRQVVGAYNQYLNDLKEKEKNKDQDQAEEPPMLDEEIHNYFREFICL